MNIQEGILNKSARSIGRSMQQIRQKKVERIRRQRQKLQDQNRIRQEKLRKRQEHARQDDLKVREIAIRKRERMAKKQRETAEKIDRLEKRKEKQHNREVMLRLKSIKATQRKNKNNTQSQENDKKFKHYDNLAKQRYNDEKNNTTQKHLGKTPEELSNERKIKQREAQKKADNLNHVSTNNTDIKPLTDKEKMAKDKHDALMAKEKRAQEKHDLAVTAALEQDRRREEKHKAQMDKLKRTGKKTYTGDNQEVKTGAKEFAKKANAHADVINKHISNKPKTDVSNKTVPKPHDTYDHTKVYAPIKYDTSEWKKKKEAEFNKSKSKTPEPKKIDPEKVKASETKQKLAVSREQRYQEKHQMAKEKHAAAMTKSQSLQKVKDASVNRKELKKTNAEPKINKTKEEPKKIVPQPRQFGRDFTPEEKRANGRRVKNRLIKKKQALAAKREEKLNKGA